MHSVAFPSVTVLADHCVLGKAAPGCQGPSWAPPAGQGPSKSLRQSSAAASHLASGFQRQIITFSLGKKTHKILKWGFFPFLREQQEGPCRNGGGQSLDEGGWSIPKKENRTRKLIVNHLKKGRGRSSQAPRGAEGWGRGL